MQEAIVEQQQPDQEAVAETTETEPVASVEEDQPEEQPAESATADLEADLAEARATLEQLNLDIVVGLGEYGSMSDDVKTEWLKKAGELLDTPGCKLLLELGTRKGRMTDGYQGYEHDGSCTMTISVPPVVG